MFTEAKICSLRAKVWHIALFHENVLFFQINLVFPLLSKSAFDPDADLFG